MTPLGRLLFRFLPGWAVVPVLAVIYAALLTGIVFTLRNVPDDHVYIDVRD